MLYRTYARQFDHDGPAVEGTLPYDVRVLFCVVSMHWCYRRSTRLLI